ncbi:hypothetical protein [Cryobacterium zhongshanensis]|uniref:Uncharacterized protein n=1 Tax=Cryobacterium zhongshanensis TaxID=2928153 RepID=A0AA41QZF0_9MICO|nr:hypothetical protein [Cryobacterium zhongshanensis]MCI4659614.1 hypothetical protein [Cryobacterium zhongshanensis]
MSDETQGTQRPERARANRFAGLVANTPRPTRIAVAITVVAVMVVGVTAGASGIVQAVNKAAHSSALTANDQATVALATARETNAATSTTLSAGIVAGAALSAKVTALVGAAAGLADPGALTALEAASKRLGDTVASIAADRRLDLSTGVSIVTAVADTTVPALPPDAETDAIASATSYINRLTADASGSVKGNAYLTATIEKATKAVHDAFAPVVNSVPAGGQARLDASASAGTPERDALTAAIAAVNNDDSALDTLWAYTQAGIAAKSSHDAVEAQKAADAAAAAQKAAEQAAATVQAKSRSSSGGSAKSGSTSGSSSSAGGSSSSGSSSSSGGSASSSTAPKDGSPTWYPLQIHAGGSDCQGAGGGQQVSYGSTLQPPANAFSVNTYEIPGYGWGVKWTCDTGW